MAINPFRKGGNDTIPIVEGGTGATNAAGALANIGALDNAAHALISHAGLPGVPTNAPSVIHQSNPDLVISNATNPGGYDLVVPASTLTTDGDELIFKVVLEGTNAGSEAINVSFGGVGVLTTAFFNATAFISYTTFYYRFYRTGATTGRFVGVHEGGGDVPTTTKTALPLSYVGNDSVALTWANPLTFNITNVNATNNVVRSVQAIKYPQVP